MTNIIFASRDELKPMIDNLKIFLVLIFHTITMLRYPYSFRSNNLFESEWRGGPHGVTVRITIKSEIVEWLENNCKKYVINSDYSDIYFYRKQDAVMFKMTWL